MDWRLRVAKAAVVNRLPLRAGLRRAKRQLFGYAAPIGDNLQHTLADYAQMTAMLDSLGRTFARAAVLEIGSGWFPTIPLVLARDGARHVYLTDVTPNMDEATFGAAAAFIAKRLQWHDVHSTRFADYPFTYLAPFDADGVDDGSLDYVISRSVLEHVPTDELPALLAPFRTKLRASGLMLHLIDHSDHLAHGDPSLSMINFLTWSPQMHRTVCRIAGGGENRLRHHEYRRIFEDAGYEVVAIRAKPNERALRQLPALRLAPPYSTMAPDELAVLRSLYVLRAA
jgi:hypothetical protein